MIAADVCIKFFCVWTFLAGPQNAQVVWQQETWKTQELCEKSISKFQRAYNEQVECVRLVVNHPVRRSK